MAACLILVAGLPLAVYLARAQTRLKYFLQISLLFPMLLPPTVVGYLLLIMLGNGSPVVEVLGLRLLFTPYGAALAGAVSGLPLMVLTAASAIGSVDRRLEDVARTLGASELQVFWDVTLPLSGKGIAAGMLLAVARATGEFGATLMVSGSIPGRTRTLSIALYEAIQLGDQTTAFGIVLVLTGLIVIVVALLRILEGQGLPWKA
ncbi:MAG: ABC transporter permease subunit [Acidobacteriota bacterium]|nr:MAG: ABC transporter permease subunit [Acidobacteriota bacterium]